jgi:hypothetical protein
MISKTGSIKEQEEKDMVGESDFAPGFFDLMEEWIKLLY